MYGIELYMTSLADNLAKLIKSKDMTFRGVSLSAGLNPQAVYDIVNGNTKSPTVDTLTRISKVLNVPTTRITGEKANHALDLEILGVCLLWVLQNIERLSNLPPERIVDELIRQYGRMLSDRIGDKMEAVRITRYLFENLLDQRELPALSKVKTLPAPKAKAAAARKIVPKAKPAVKKPPGRSAQK